MDDVDMDAPFTDGFGYRAADGRARIHDSRINGAVEQSVLQRLAKWEVRMRSVP